MGIKTIDESDNGDVRTVLAELTKEIRQLKEFEVAKDAPQPPRTPKEPPRFEDYARANSFTSEKQEYDYRVNKRSSKGWYIYPVGLIVASVGFSIWLFIEPTFSKVYFIISLFVTIPIVLSSVVTMIGRFAIVDAKRVRKTIIKKLSKNFIIATVFKNNKRFDRKVCIINSDGKTISDGKKDYIVDLEGIWYDENGHPNIFVLDNLPNNLLFAFAKNLDKFVADLIAKKVSVDADKKIIDVSYSSENIQLLKKDKIFTELHRDPSANNLLMIAFGLMALSWVAVILMAVFKK